MKLAKAMERLDEIRQVKKSVLLLDSQEAIQLGIEALKRVQHVRQTYQRTSYVFLPGETEK